MFYPYSALIFTFFVFVVGSRDENVEVETQHGRLSGKNSVSFNSNVVFHSFRGIPYAEPPVGELRFQPPKPHRGWESTYKAHTNKPPCLQFNSRMRNGEEYGISGSEDCLYLNVYTATLNSENPVVVFDYHDNFKTGFNETTYSPDFFMENGVVVVTINHRLGALGYLTTDDGIIPANNGIKDFILALKWIQDNIKYFGGDPNNVTLMGSNGGAALIDLLLYTEKAKGLFHKVILQSGTVLEPHYFSNDARENAFELAKLVNITTDDSQTLLKKLQDVNAEEIVKNEGIIGNDEIQEINQRTVLSFAPIIDTDAADSVVPSLPEKSKIVNDVPVLIGLNSREGLDLAAPFIYEPRYLQDITYDNFFLHFPVRTHFRIDRNSTGIEKVIQEVWDFYFSIGYVSANYAYEYAVYIGDVIKSYALNYEAKRIAKEISSPVFFYMFDFRGVLNENSEFMTRRARTSMELWGATLMDDLCYLFVCKRIKKNYKEITSLVSEQPEIKTSKKMLRLWTNFIKTGNPTPAADDEILKNLKWTPISKDSEKANYLHITKRLTMKQDPLGDREKFWDRFLEKYSAMAENGVVRNIVKDEL